MSRRPRNKAPKPATYEDILALPEHLVGQILDGELIVSPRPATPHQVAAGALWDDLSNPFQRGRGGPGGWILLAVLSPSTAKVDRTRKLKKYARAGVQFAWLVDPELHSLEVYELRDRRWTLVEPSPTRRRCEPLRSTR